jgi:hypothetical protein
LVLGPAESATRELLLKLYILDSARQESANRDPVMRLASRSSPGAKRDP